MSLRVLVLEDEPLIALDLEAALEEAGHVVVAVCGTLAEAQARIDDAFDVALLDVDLPDGRSFDLARILRESGREVVFVSGSRVGDVPAALRDAPFLAKPYQSRLLLGVVAEFAAAGARAGEAARAFA